MKNFFYIIFSICTVNSVFGGNSVAQTLTDFKSVDSISYQLYMNKDWNGLIRLNDEINFDSCDFLYLRLRLGIAFYEKQQYYNSTKQFKTALNFDDRNNTALEYLYFAYLYTGQDAEAIAISSKFTSRKKTELEIKNNEILNVKTCGGIALSNNQKLNGKIDIDGAENLFGEIDKNKNMYSGSLIFTGKIFSKCLLITGYNYLIVDKSKEIRYYYHVPPQNLGHPPTQEESAKSIKHETKTSEYKITQNEFHLGTQIALNKGWKIFPAVHLINYNYNTIITDYDKTKDNYVLKKDEVNKTNFIGAIEISKKFKKINIGLGQSYSNFYDKTQLQTELAFTYYPKKNKDVIAISALTYFNENNKGRFLLSQKIGRTFGQKAYADINLTFGNLKNAQQANGFIVYNIADATNLKIGAQFSYALSQRLSLSMHYDYISRIGYYTTRTKTVQEKYITTKYQYNSLILGLKWKF